MPRDRADPEARWRCCADWQRTLGNKSNSREFAARHGCRVPKLYWHGRRLGGLPIDSLPEHYVIRPTTWASRRGVYVMAGRRELLHGVEYPAASLRRALLREYGRVARLPVLVEEFVRTEAGEYRLPTEYKCHCFGETIGAIEVARRTTHTDGRVSYYTPAWERVADRMNTSCPPDLDVDPPRCLPELLSWARRLGAVYGTYVRVDFYSTDRGCVFGEFSSRPVGGHGFTPYAERYFGELWQRAFPHEVPGHERTV